VYDRCVEDAVAEVIVTVRGLAFNEMFRRLFGTANREIRAYAIGVARDRVGRLTAARKSDHLDARGGSIKQEGDADEAFRSEVAKVKSLWTELVRLRKSGHVDEWRDLAVLAKVKTRPDAYRANIGSLLAELDSGVIGWRGAQPLALALRHAAMNLADDELLALNARSLERRFYASASKRRPRTK
jgi:hypothetical protein